MQKLKILFPSHVTKRIRVVAEPDDRPASELFRSAEFVFKTTCYL